MKRPAVGVCEWVGRRLRRVLAPNPGPMTRWGTNTFIVGSGTVAVIDPGPNEPAHLAALLAALEGERVSHILVTHAHLDHSALAPSLSRETGAPILGFGPPNAGRSPTMERLAEEGLVRGGEGVDEGFRPEISLADGDRIEGEDWAMSVVHTPGHFAGHLAFDLGNGTALTGDHVMDWSSSLVSPPDGEVSAFRRTTERLRDAGYRRLFPSHGGTIDRPEERLSWLLAHRKRREDEILSALGPIPKSLRNITRAVYTDIPPAMLPAAARNVLAHLIDLSERSEASTETITNERALWRRT